MPFFRIDKKILKHLDWWLLASLVCIMAIGITNLYSASAATNRPFAIKQAVWYAVGLVGITALISLDYRKLQRFVYPLYALTLFCLLLVDIIGASAKGAQRWLALGFFNFQPSELAKLTTIILVAHLFSKTGKLNHSFKDILLPAALLSVPFGLILIQPDLGTAGLVALIAVTMVFMAGLRWTTLVLLFLSVISVLPFGWRFLKPYQKDRILSFLNPESGVKTEGYHALQSKIAIGSGQINGKGFLQGTQAHLSFLPESHTDFAFALWAEEWGMVGSLVLLLIYFILLWRGVRIASETKDRFGALLASGVVIMLFWQISINCAMVTGVFPVVGVPFPLISYGGSSVVMTLAAIGLLLSIKVSRYLNTPSSKGIKGELTPQ
ncbi:MAG: rod shape-determining protein RodA [Deltaproteobacteria bacterium]|nr:rod shape-determining protein RodA [Deltaproteobacteria bacterium]